MPDPALDNGQLAGLLGTITLVGGSLAGAIKWAVGRLGRSQDRSSAATERMVEVVTRLDSKVDTLLKINGHRSGMTTQERRRISSPTEPQQPYSTNDSGEGYDDPG